jgi:hypothetical protein
MSSNAAHLRKSTNLSTSLFLSCVFILVTFFITTGVAQAEFVPGLTPEAPKVFAENPSTEIVIPEVYELFTIAIALANIEDFLPSDLDANRFLINKTTPYYQEVEAQFGEYRDHPFIVNLRQGIEPVLKAFDVAPLLAYRYQTLGYTFDETNKLVSTGLYIPMLELDIEGDSELESIKEGIPFDLDDPKSQELVNDFVEVTNFRQFYKDQQSYYDAQIKLTTDLCDIAAARDWLASQFPAAYDNHTLVLSPLVGGTHNFFPVSTVDESTTQALMYANIFRGEGESVADVSVVDRTDFCRTSFTEIDHGYVNPATNLYKAEVDEAMPDISAWNTAEENRTVYATPYDTFNEYMTFATYALFLTESLPATDQEEAIQSVEKMMVENRQFAKFKEFNHELMRLYQERESDQTVTDLYPAVLEWVSSQNE